MNHLRTIAWLSYLIISFFLSFSSVVSADPLDEWQWRSPLPQGNRVNAIASGKDIIVAVGDAGIIITSPDGIRWMVRSTPTSSNLTGIVYGSDTFTAVGNSGTILTSPDGISWTGQTSPVSGTDLTGIAYGNNAFVAVGKFSKGIITSPDGVAWSYHSLSSYDSISFSRITYSNNAFFTMGWENCSGWCLITGNGLPVVYSSPDGIVWTGPEGSSLYPSLAGDGYGVVYGNGVYLKISGSWNANVSVSSDAVTWTQVSLPNATIDASKKIYFIENNFYILGGYGYIATSPDGANWTLVTSKPLKPIRKIAFGNGVWVAIGDTIIYTSTDGISWSPQYSPDNNSYDLTGVAYGNNKFVAVGLYNAVLTSPDGKKWTKTTLGFGLVDVAFGNGIFVGVSLNNLLTSPDGTNWTVKASYPPVQYRGTRFSRVTFGNGTFAAIGSDTEQSKDVVYTSPDGVSWMAHILSTGGWVTGLNDICYGNNTFLIVGNLGYVYTSSDGATWSIRQAGAPTPGGGVSYNDRYGVTYGDGLFVSVGERNTEADILSSADGIAWTRRKSIAGNSLDYVAYVNHTFMASSKWGDVFQSARYDSPTPDQFIFNDQTNVALNTVLTSNVIMVSGIDTAAPISVIDGTYSINGGSYTNASGMVSNGDTVTVRQTSSMSYSTTTNVTLIIGGVFDTFSVTTPLITLNVHKSGTGLGTLVSIPPGIDCGTDCNESYTSSASVTLTAQSSAGSTFAGWSGGLCSGTGTCIIQVDGVKSVTATFIDVYGDVNGDGSTTMMDAILALQIITGLQTSDEISSGADVNNDDKIGLEEIIYILQKAAGMI